MRGRWQTTNNDRLPYGVLEMAFVEQFVRRPQGLWLRKAIFQVHLWTGIAMGLYVVAISVSGSALFFRSALNEATPGRKVVAGSGPLLTKAELLAAAKRAYPDYAPGNVSASQRLPARAGWRMSPYR